jgi:hypothetical protein
MSMKEKQRIKNEIMTELEVYEPKRAKAKCNATGLVALNLSGGQIFTVKPDGSDRKVKARANGASAS